MKSKSFTAKRDNRGAFATGRGSRARNIDTKIYIENYKESADLKQSKAPIFYGLPNLPSRYQPRNRDLDIVRAKTLNARSPIGIVSAPPAVGVQGMGGIGKTVLATILVHDPELRAAFPDGIAWLSFGRQVPFLAKASEFAFAITGIRHSFATVSEAKGTLGSFTRDKRMLVVLDDIWEPEAADPFSGLDSGCRLLITTRDARVLERAGAERYELGLLRSVEARAFLATAAGIVLDALPAEAWDIVRECGRLPLALAAVGALIRRGTFTWADALTTLQEADLDHLDTSWLPDPEQRSLAIVVKISFDSLSSDAHACVFSCAALREDVDLPESLLLKLWTGTIASVRQGKLIAQELVDCSLLSRDEAHNYRIHDLYMDYLRHAAGPLKERHRRFIELLVGSLTMSTADCPDDGYCLQYVPWHLREAGELGMLRSLLFDPNWLRRKVKSVGVNAVISDYGLADQDDEVRRIRRAFIRSGKILSTYPEHMDAQLCGRLKSDDGPHIMGLLTIFRAVTPPLFVPTRNGYLHSTRPLRPVVPATGPGDAIAILSDGCRALSGFDDETVRIWDITSGEEVGRITGHTDWVRAVSVLPDGRRALTGSDDETLRLWDIETGEELKRFEGHTDWVRAVAVLPGGRQAISGSYDGTLRLWDIESGAEQQLYTGHASGVTTVALLPDGYHALSGSRDQTVRLWNLKTGAELRQFKFPGCRPDSIAILPKDQCAIIGFDNGTLILLEWQSGLVLRRFARLYRAIGAVAVMPDQRSILTGSDDRTLRLWDVSKGIEVARFIGDDPITAIAISGDGRQIVVRDRNGRVMGFSPSSRSRAHSTTKTRLAAHQNQYS
jgi:WD40 repeat protein